MTDPAAPQAPRRNDLPRLGALGTILTPGSRGNRQLLMGLFAVAVVIMISADLRYVLQSWRFGVDLEGPLRAAERWAAGGEPYLAEAFAGGIAGTQPFLYPPYVLPLLAPFTALPRLPLQALWVAFCLVSALFALRRLRFPTWTWPLALLWSPLLEGVLAGNVQVPVFACFVGLFWRSSTSDPALNPPERDVDDPRENDVKLGLLATAIGAIKVSQPHAWVYLLRRRPRAAVVGAALIGVVALATLAVTGLDPWFDWLAQLRRASDPSWELGGIAVARLIDPLLGFLLFGAGLVLLFVWAPQKHAGAWVGVVSVVAASSLHTFGMLFLVPAMLLIRRELALIAAMLIATTTYQGTWAAIGIVAAAMVVTALQPGTSRSESARPALLE